MKDFFSSTRFKVFAAILVLLLIFAVVSAFSGAASPASSVLGAVLSPVRKAAVWVSNELHAPTGDAAAYRAQIDALKAELEELRGQLADSERYKQENEQYRLYLELKKQNPDFVFEDAQIISRDTADIFGSFTISKGSLDGISVNDPVISGKYLVGRVFEVGPTYAKVRTILAPEVNVSAYEVRTREPGVVGGDVELAERNMCRMSYLNRDTSITSGSLVCTSSVGGTYPGGLIIGTVSQVKNDNHDISAYAMITAGADIMNLKDVFVITDFRGQGVDGSGAATKAESTTAAGGETTSGTVKP